MIIMATPCPKSLHGKGGLYKMMMMMFMRGEKDVGFTGDDVYYYIGERLKLERETENMCV